MTELEYGINVANKFDLLFGDEDPTEVLNKAGDAKKKKADPKAAAPAGNVLKEKTARSATGKPVEGKPGDKKVEAGKDAKKPGQQGQQQGAAKAPAAGGQQGQQQRPPRSAPQGGRPEQGGKENSSDAQRRPPQQKSGDQQRSPAAAGGQQQGPRRPFGGPRPEGSAPPRRPAPMDHDFGGSSGPMTGDQEVPEQRTGFGGGRGFRGGASGFRGGRASPRHQYPREGAEAGGVPAHARGREYDRHSGSNKTGVKPIQKREGGGSHNWGSYRDDAELGAEAAHAPEGAAPPSAEKPPAGEEGATEAVHVEGAEGAEAGEPAEPQVHEKTLKEWMEEEERNRLRPKYATRAANEGEPEQKVFQKMRRVQREKAGADGMVEVVEYVEVDVDEDSHVPAGGSGKSGRGGPFQLVFAPASRPEGGFRGEGRGRGGPRGGRGGERGGRGRGGYQGGNQGHQGGHRGGQAPPKQDELNFPPLG